MRLCRRTGINSERTLFPLSPANAFGPDDDFHPENAHVIPSLLRKIHAAKVKAERRLRSGEAAIQKRIHLCRDLAMPPSSSCRNMEVRSRSTSGRSGHHDTGIGRNIRKVVGYRALWSSTERNRTGACQLLDVTKLNGMQWRPRVSLRRDQANL